MRYALQNLRPRFLALQHSRSSSQTRNIRIDRRTQAETLPEEQLRREDNKTYRVRQHGNKELPLPPQLDPTVHAARMKYTRLDKPTQRDVPLTDFQKELASNPYAHALVTKLRQDKLTRALLPAHFLHRLDVQMYQDVKVKKLRFLVPSDDVTQREWSGIESGYANNRSSLFDGLARIARKEQLGHIISLRASEQAAMLAEKSPKSYRASKFLVWDKDMNTKIEEMLLARAQAILASTVAEYNELFMDLEDAMTRLPNIIAFVQLEQATTTFNTLRGKPCYGLSSVSAEPVGAGLSSDIWKNLMLGKTVALIRHESTVPLVLALDRLFTFKELYTKQEHEESDEESMHTNEEYEEEDEESIE